MEHTSDEMPSLSILIVEDDKDSREILSILLQKKFPDLRLYTATDGFDGLELFRKLLPDNRHDRRQHAEDGRYTDGRKDT